MLAKHTAYYTLAQALVSLLNLVALAVYTRALVPDEYGVYALIVASVSFGNVVLFQWLRLILLRFLPANLDDPRPLLSTVLFAFLAVVALTATVGCILVLIRPEPTRFIVVLLAVTLLWAQAWFELNLEIARSLLVPLRYGFMSIVRAVAALGLGVVGVTVGLGAYAPLSGQAIAMIMAVAGFSTREWRGIRPKLDIALFRAVARYGLPLTATFALGFVISTSDRFIVAAFLGEGAAGLYSAVYDLGHKGLAVVMTVTNLAAYPLAVRALESHGLDAARRQLRRNGTLLLAVSVPAAVGMAVLAPSVVQLLGTSFRKDGSVLLPVVALSILLWGVRGYHFDLAFQLGKDTLGQVWITGVAALMNVVLNLLWIPRMGIVGAAYATLVAYLVALILSIVLGRRVLLVPISGRDILGIVTASGLMAIVLAQSTRVTGIKTLIAHVLIGGTIYLSTLALLNVGGYYSKVRALVHARLAGPTK